MTKFLTQAVLAVTLWLLLFLFTLAINPRYYGHWLAEIQLQYEQEVYVDE